MLAEDIKLSSPSYAFSHQHYAEIKVINAEHSFTVEPVEVAKDHLVINLALDNALVINGRIDRVEVDVLNKSFVFSDLLIVQLTDKQGRKGQRAVLYNEDNVANNRALWALSYLLRMAPIASEFVHYDELNLPKVPARGVYTETARQERLAFIRQQTNSELTQVADTQLEPTSLVSNIEALVGSVEVPVGIAGPLYIRGSHADGLFYAPMATSEGALVASATRGATALSRSGGVKVHVIGQRMLRVPVFVLDSFASALFFAEWVKDHQHEIAGQTRKYSNYAQLVDINTELMGHSVHVQFAYETGDAAGQNMTTTCTWQACQWIIAQMKSFEDISFNNFLVEANLSNDKKVTYNSFVRGRGIRVLAECILTEEVCRKVLKVSPKQLFSAYNHFIAGSIASGMVGMNINIANVIAAMFTATGQDIACVHESAIGQLSMEITDDNAIYVTLRLPSLVVGSVGGGTNLPRQKECLELIGCAGPGCAHKLAEIITAFCLALDISTLSAIASDQFARAHEKLGRNRPVNWLKLGDLNSDFFQRAMQNNVHTFGLELDSVQALTLEQTGSSIITELTAHKVNKLLGHFPFQLTFADSKLVKKVMVKVKPLDDEVILMFNSMAAMCDARLAHAYNEFKNALGFKACHQRELVVMSQTDERFVKYAPLTYHTWQDESREAYVLVQELMEDMELMDSADDTSGWTKQHLQAAITGIAEVHSIWYGKEAQLLNKPWLKDAPNRENMLAKTRLWEMLGAHSVEEFPEWFSEQDGQRFRDRLYSLTDWYAEIDAMPKTLIHNDFTPRNIAFRRIDGQLRLCAYDWELATVHLPQHDLAELLVFTLQPDFDLNDLEYYIELHRLELAKYSEQVIDAQQWRRGFTLALWDIVVNRMPMYNMAHTFRHYKFMDRVQATFRRLLDVVTQEAS